MGQLRICLTPTEKVKAAGFWAKLSPKRAYEEIISAAKKDE